MIQEQQLKQIAPILQHVFCLKIGRITFREVENACANALKGNAEEVHALITMFLTGQIQQERVAPDALPLLKNMIAAFAAPIRVAHDVYQHGDFLFTATSELMGSPANNENNAVFLHRMRRVDGKEFDFLCDLQRTTFMMRHFCMRFEETLAQENGAATLQEFTGDLQIIREKIGELLIDIASKSKASAISNKAKEKIEA